MTTSNDMHRPTPEFREHLEWELVSTFRRESRRRDRRRQRMLRWGRAAALVLVSVAIGATAGLAPAQIRDGARRDSLLQAARANADLAMLRLQLARDNFADVQRKVDVGALGAASLAAAELERRGMEARVMRVRYDIEEITASAQPPRDDLNAPLVNGRDFVKDRIQLELLSAQQRLTAAEAAQAEVERRVRVGAGTELSRLEAGLEVVRARSAMAVLAERLKLRREFVEKGTPVDQLQRRLEEAELRAAAYGAQQGLELARQRLTLLEKQREVGAVEELEVMKARVDVKERELELQQIALRLRPGGGG